MKKNPKIFHRAGGAGRRQNNRFYLFLFSCFPDNKHRIKIRKAGKEEAK